jgi:hypothetical protein
MHARSSIGAPSLAVPAPFSRWAATPPQAPDRGLAIEFVLFAISIAGVVAGTIGIAAGVVTSPLNIMVVGDWYVMTSGLLIVVAGTDQRKAMLKVAGAVAAAAVLAYALVRATGMPVDAKVFVKLSVAAAATATIAAQFVSGLRADGATRRRRLRIACFAAALVILPIGSGWGVQVTSLVPTAYDPAVAAMDDSLGVRIPALVRSVVWNHPLLNYVTFRVYISVSLAAVAWDVVRRDFRDWRMIKLLLVSSVVGFAFYFVTPVAGTTFLTPDYNPPGAPIVALPFEGVPRNCMPSLHTTWALFLIAGAITQPRRNLLERAAAVLFPVYGLFTIAGALAFGDHYFFDCIVAIPFAVMVYALYGMFADDGFRQARNWIAFASSGALFAIWVVLIRSAPGAANAAVLLLMLGASVALGVLFVLHERARQAA